MDAIRCRDVDNLSFLFVMKTLRNAGIAALALLVMACSSSEHRAYILSPDGPAPQTAGVSLGIGPVRLTDYLQRPEIAVEQGPNELEYAYESLWAGSLEKQIVNTMGVNLGRQLNTGSISNYPWPTGSGIDYQVTLDVRRFHAGTDGRAVLDTGWRVYDLNRKRIVVSRSSYLEEEMQGEGFSAAAAAQSRLLSRLAREIAAVLK